MTALTPREHEIMADLMKGMTSQQSAKASGNSANTVKTQRQTILRKLKAQNVAHAVAIYLDAIPPRGDKWQGTA